MNDIVLDVKRAKFVVLKDEKIKSFQIPVTVLYNKEDLVANYIQDNMNETNDNKVFVELVTVLNAIRTNWKQYNYNVNIATDMDEDEQKDWFNVLNLAGSRVTQDMVFLSDLLVQGIDFYKEYAEPFRSLLEEYDLLSLYPRKSAEVSVPLAALNASYERIEHVPVHVLNRSPIPSDTQPKLIAKASVENIRQMFSMSLSALESALEYFEKQNIKVTRIDYITNVMGYFVFAPNHRIDDKAIQDIQGWIKPNLFTNKSNGQRREVFQNLIDKTGNIDVKKR